MNEPESSPEATAQRRAEVLTKATFRAAERLGLSQAELASMLATSASTISRLKSRALVPGSAEMQLAALFVRIYRSLDSLVGADDKSGQAWLRADNYHLGGIPLELMATIQGMVAVASYLDAMRGAL